MKVDSARHKKRTSRVYVFDLSSDDIKSLLPAQREQHPEFCSFDSEVEERFWNDFSSIKSGWAIKREPELIFLRSGAVMIPDFGFEKDGAKVYMEIIGFWTKEYMEKKIHKIAQIGLSNLIVAVNRKLEGAKRFIGLTDDVVFYSRRVPIKPILERLRAIEAQLLSKNLAQLGSKQFALHGDILDLSQISRNMGVMLEALKTYIKMHPQTGYTLIGDQLVSAGLTSEIGTKLGVLGDKTTLIQASGLIEKAGIANPQSLLGLLGYEVRWSGIRPDKALVSRKAK